MGGEVTTARNRASVIDDASRQAFLLRQGILKLLEVKDSDIRILDLEQARDAVDKGIHPGGAFSAVVPMVALYYGGFMNLDLAEPTRRGQDLFVLSKGHAVATLASVYSDLGYFDRSVLKNSRSWESILNGHPGPILPNVHISTGPLGQGLSVAQGFAIAGKTCPKFDTYCLVGDGELQEGPIWEAVMYSAHKRLDNLCVLVDNNVGQLDIVDRLIFPLPNLEAVFGSFGWNVRTVDATGYDGVFEALDQFKHAPRTGKPTAIVCRSRKGHGAFASFLNGHKVTVTDELVAQELALQSERRRRRVEEFNEFLTGLGESDRDALLAEARRMNIDLNAPAFGAGVFSPPARPVLTRRAAPRDKRIQYDPAQLPKIDKSKQYAASAIVTAAMKVFAKDTRVISVDADLASTSGLEAGVGAVDQERALNVGVAEANMMNVGEAFAALGYNAWVSTFCPFFDWKVLRRIAVGHQERLEAIEAKDGWLSEGHGLDLTFLATAPNFETRTNGATHMGNDDVTIFDGMAHLKIIDVSCPQQLLAIMQWIMAGNRGMVYLRIMRAGSGVLYEPDYVFEFGKGYALRQSPSDKAVIISSGRGVHEALKAAAECEKQGVAVGVVDMPSVDEGLLVDLYDSGKLLSFAEHNNGYLWRSFQTALFRRGGRIETGRAFAVNALDKDGRPRFIHSGTYEQLLRAFGLDPAALAQAITRRLIA